MFYPMLFGLILLAPTSSYMQDKIDGKLLIGKWELQNGTKGLKVTLEYKKDNKLNIEVESEGVFEKFNGTYQLEGDKLDSKFKFRGVEQNETYKILKITDKELVTKNTKTGTEDIYKRTK